MRLKKLMFYGTMTFSLMTTLCLAEEIYIENDSHSGYVEMDNDGNIEGFIEDFKGRSVFIEGELLDNIVDDGSNFYDVDPRNEDFFDQISEFEEDEDFFGQDYEIYLEEE